jgi:hypothetical protein
MIMVGGLARWAKYAVMGEVLGTVRRPRGCAPRIRGASSPFVPAVLRLGRLLSVWAARSPFVPAVLRLGLIHFPAVANPVSVWGTSSL